MYRSTAPCAMGQAAFPILRIRSPRIASKISVRSIAGLYSHKLSAGGCNELRKAPISSNLVLCFRVHLSSVAECTRQEAGGRKREAAGRERRDSCSGDEGGGKAHIRRNGDGKSGRNRRVVFPRA